MVARGELASKRFDYNGGDDRTEQSDARPSKTQVAERFDASPVRQETRAKLQEEVQMERDQRPSTRRAESRTDDSGRVAVKDGDSLYSIAKRRLKEDGEGTGGRAIHQEINRLKKLNQQEFKSLARDPDFLANGWKLRLYDDGAKPQTNRSAEGLRSREPQPSAAVEPGNERGSRGRQRTAEYKGETPAKLGGPREETPETTPRRPSQARQAEAPATQPDRETQRRRPPWEVSPAPTTRVEARPTQPEARRESAVPPAPVVRSAPFAAPPAERNDPNARTTGSLEPSSAPPERPVISREQRAAIALSPERAAIAPPPERPAAAPPPERPAAVPTPERFAAPSARISPLADRIAQDPDRYLVAPDRNAPRAVRPHQYSIPPEIGARAPGPYYDQPPTRPSSMPPDMGDRRTADGRFARPHGVEKFFDDGRKFVQDLLEIPEKFLRSLSERSNFYGRQNTSYNCGPAAIAMAIADKRHSPPSAQEINQLTRATRTSGDGLPDWRVAIPRALQSNFETQNVELRAGDKAAAIQALDAKLAQGYKAVAHVNNPLTGNGHFIYIAGKTNDGRYIIGDPNGRSTAVNHDKPISAAKLASMMVEPQRGRRSYKGIAGFTAVR